jgi:hypothetical protein
LLLLYAILWSNTLHICISLFFKYQIHTLLEKTRKAKWTDTGSAAKKIYEGWVEEGIEFFNDQVTELQILRRTATSKSMEEKYLQKKREKMEEKSKGPVK